MVILNKLLVVVVVVLLIALRNRKINKVHVHFSFEHDTGPDHNGYRKLSNLTDHR